MNDTTTIGIIFVVIFTVAGLVAVILRSRSGIFSTSTITPETLEMGQDSA
jgi:hypothetical protein